MASALLELRKQAGFKNAKDYAAAEGIAEATYARYESSPEKIPLAAAWRLADEFGVSIDITDIHALEFELTVDAVVCGHDVANRIPHPGLLAFVGTPL